MTEYKNVHTHTQLVFFNNQEPVNQAKNLGLYVVFDWLKINATNNKCFFFLNSKVLFFF